MRGEGEGMEGEGEGMTGEGEGMEGEGGNERRVLRADKSGTRSQLQHQCQFQDQQELTMTLTRGTCGGGCLHVVKHSSDQNPQLHYNIPGSFHPWSAQERTP